MYESVDDFEAVFGEASAEVTGGARPLLFSLQASDALHLCLCVTDFHAHTWSEDFSVDQLSDLRDEVGIGGSWSEFLAYLRAALSSGNVKVQFGSSANAGMGSGVPVANVVAQKAKGTPRLSLPVKKVEGSEVQPVMAAIALGLFQSYKVQESLISSERARAADLMTSLTAEKARIEKLQEQLEVSGVSYSGKRKTHRERSAQFFSTPTASQPTQSLSQFESQYITPSLTVPAIASEQPKDVVTTKPAAGKSKVHVAPASRRAKRRGTAISANPD